MPRFPFTEKHLSQLPALMQLINLGYDYLSPQEVNAERGGQLSNVLLENILREQLKRINRITRKGEEHRFSEENIQSAIDRLKNIRYEGLLQTNRRIYDDLVFGIALEQNIEGDRRSYTLNYIDWNEPENNAFHTAAEFSAERRNHPNETVRPDIVLFVNGIPLAVMECKAPNVDVTDAISQSIRNQGDDHIPKLFTFAQMLLAMNKNKAKYATVGSNEKFWSEWKEAEDTDDQIASSVNQPLADAQKDVLFSGEFSDALAHFNRQKQAGGREITEQDRCIFGLCRPERLLEFVRFFTLFEHHEKKIARHQQFFSVRQTLKRIKRPRDDSPHGGVVWHTQGSGKSITMVMLVRALMLDRELSNPRIILVTDRINLDDQLTDTFRACGYEIVRAATGRDLVQHITNKADIITTVINKFESALSDRKFSDESPNIIVLADEVHRTQYGDMAADMRRMLPNACYIGFTGTPLIAKDKPNTFARFGPMIEPSYSMREAVADGAVVPLIYEGRHIEMRQNKKQIDKWFERSTADLNERQKADLKRKYARAQTLNEADRVIHECAFDISEHYRNNWQGTGLKGQLTAPAKAAALKYREYFREFGYVSTEVIISAPDTRKGYEEVGEDPTNEVGKFWQRMMEKYGKEQTYNDSIIKRFKNEADPEILIVVDKLLTGFDAPRNTVLYLCRPLKEHTLLQAIARVNRLYEGKKAGYIIDYAHVLEELDNALTAYDALKMYDSGDLEDFLTSINARVEKLPQHHADLLNIFKKVANSSDEEEYERLLADQATRDDFYARLSVYSGTLATALSSEKFMHEVDDAALHRYKRDLKHFQKLRDAVNLRYADRIDYRKYGARIKKLIDQHVDADGVTPLYSGIDIFNPKELGKVRDGADIYETKTKAARADIIANATKRSLNEKMDEDPALHQRFSTLIQAAIDDFRQRRINDEEYFNRISKIHDDIVTGSRDDVPAEIRKDKEACAYFGVIKPCLKNVNGNLDEMAAKTAAFIKETIQDLWKVDFWNDADVQKELGNAIDNFLYDLEDECKIDLPSAQMDKIFSDTTKVAKRWRP